MKAIMTGVALAAVIAAAPALAAGQGQQVAQAQPQAEAPQKEMHNAAPCPEGADANAEACGPATTGALPAAPDEADAAQSEEPQDETTEMVAKPGGKFIGEQSDDAILASELVGLAVYNPADETLGDVNDIAWTDDGGIEALIVGVGGFLGIGEKQVAVAYSAVDISTDENGNKRLMLNASSDELAAAPTFVTAAEKLAMLRAERERTLPPASDGGTVPAPAPAE